MGGPEGSEYGQDTPDSWSLHQQNGSNHPQV